MKKSEVTKAIRWKVADHLAEERLAEVNRLHKSVKTKDTFYLRHTKRWIDIFVSLVALIVTLPLNLIIGVITYIDVGGPIFFKQSRLGKDGELFNIIKFRNMRNTTDERGELLPPSQRVTKFGKFMRRSSLDELLNFWSILKGDMSLIGPRPLLPEHLHRYSDRHRQRLAVRPGLECPPSNINNQVWTWQEQFENDVWYVENVSFLTDCRMIINLIKFALNRKSTAARALVTRGIFMGYDWNGEVIIFDEVPQAYVEEAIAEADGPSERVVIAFNETPQIDTSVLREKKEAVSI